MENDKIIGFWESGNITMAFGSGNKLVYCIEDDKGDKQCAFMTYEVVGNELITDQPSMPNKTKITYEINNDILKLFGVDGDITSWKRKES